MISASAAWLWTGKPSWMSRRRTLIYDPSKSAEVKVFDCIMEEYTVKLTDHYPNIIDVRL